MTTQIQSSCMFTLYERSSENKNDDLVIVKERLRDPETGREKPSIKLVRNFKRKFWVTKKGLQTHAQKREWEYKSNLDEYECTMAELPFRVAKALGRGGGYARLSDLCASPYVYGTDITSAVLYKHQADLKANAENGTWKPNASMAVMDFETDVCNGTEHIISGAVSFKNRALIAVTEDFVKGEVDVEKRCIEMAHKLLAKDMEDRKVQLKVVVCKTDMDVVARLMGAVHAMKPDFLVFWNMGFDMKKILECCERNNVDPANIFCDPCIPPEFRRFNFRESKSNKVTASGKKMNYSTADLWHVVECPASFYVIDAMVVFKMLRVVEGMRRSYALDPILEEELGIRKLEYDAPEAAGSHNLSWHRAMQRFHKLAYLVYNLFDCISVELLDDKNGDLAKKIALYADGSEFSTLKSNPKRLANALHFYLQEQDKVICSTSSDMTEELDKFVIGKRDWIVTLANELTHKHGAKVFKPEEAGDLLSRISTHVFDIDISSGYPSGQWALNTSRSTTLAEICKIVGHSEGELRRFAVNTTNIPCNSVDMASTMLQMPSIADAIKDYRKDKGIEEPVSMAEAITDMAA